MTLCTPAFMASPITKATVGDQEAPNADATPHEVWILGMPIFREYNVLFDREKETMGFASHTEDACTDDQQTNASLMQHVLDGGSRQQQGFRLRTLPPLSQLVYPKTLGEFRFVREGTAASLDELAEQFTDETY